MNAKPLIQASWDRLRSAHKADLPALTVARARDFVANFPDCGPAWKILGSALIDLARFREAHEALMEAIALCPPEKLWIPMAELGRMHKACGNFHAAASWYRKAIEAEPEEASPRIYLGGVLAQSGRLYEAEAAYFDATQCQEGCRDEAFLNLGLILRTLDRHDEAAECFETALQLAPNYKAAKRALRDVRQTLRLVRGAGPRKRPKKSPAANKNGGVREPEAAVA